MVFFTPRLEQDKGKILLAIVLEESSKIYTLSPENTCLQGPVKKPEEFKSLFEILSLVQAKMGYKTSVRSLPTGVPSIRTTCSIFL